MADYIAQPDTAVDPDAPITSDLMYALRDNPIAMFEGAPGAPRLADAALGSTVTQTGRNWVANRYLSQPSTGIGQIVMARYLGSGAAITIGTTVGGSQLGASSAGSAISGGGLPGMWDCQGFVDPGVTGSDNQVTIWKRVS